MKNGIQHSKTTKSHINAWGITLGDLTGEAALKRLRKWIEDRDLSIKELATAIGNDTNKMERILSGEEKLIITDLFVLQGLYGLNVRHILYSEKPATLEGFIPLILD